ncbi:CBS domain-containing protein [Thermosphaera aggregans]|uniref:Putative signal transduction protein with CBS domains n=1 Tax=Thermosphaera aggregans (strain DSM 11486 / M11TL) TaxID=633148 RepID=D5U031_THEAM|nr:CBS domain-containing protein [Thermosphaera aggregans]ADG90481.1 putative signal transduction protein with CBS domains [Thermosphaera aggregans DSM 11486]
MNHSSRKPVSRRIDHYRWLRSDGTPNFSDHIYKAPSELQLVLKREVRVISPSATIMKAVEEMSRSFRSLVVTAGNRPLGILHASNIVDYLGGGSLFNIVEKRYRLNLYSALEREVVETIMTRRIVQVPDTSKIIDVLQAMAVTGSGVVLVVNKEGGLEGIVTEHDMVVYLSGVVSTGLIVKDVMSTPVAVINRKSSLKKAMEEMITQGFRRLPVVDGEVVVGMLTAVDVVRYFGSHEAFKRAITGNILEALSIPAEEIMSENLVTVREDEDLAKAVYEMLSRNVSSVLVTDEEGILKGIVTERDVLYALSTSTKRS